MEMDQLLSAYDYTLPPEQIAQTPAVPRGSSRLLVVKDLAQHGHAIFRDLPNLLNPGDLLVLNNTRVIPARLYGRKPSGLRVEILLLEPQPETHRWLALVKPGRRLRTGAQIWFGEPTVLRATVQATDPETGGRILQFDVPAGASLEAMIEQLGQIPLPPYITRPPAQPDQYQTVYAEHAGAVAAPTAGLHFTPELLQQLQARGIQQAFVTLHVGVGTFRPVEVEEITAHQMHAEWVDVSAQTVEQIQQTKARGGRVIAVGTTTVRSLEAAAQSGTLQPLRSKTDLFIYPGYQWRVVDGLITNFHLPKSSLLMLVSALIGRQRLLDLYQVAIAAGYRFYSFGDAMLILPEAKVKGGRSEK
ncbi:tRNA preQ1(34) S-adenosylmethionine ribosyltransferase-isomerase QueA [Leptothermofonsia sichuanensis E412]|uniref:tRNA preQ1(34) S-adenosylmethionine ribosyltransferase-isomerase QueA n=1 Tax=Leptothermofonsia sichuanensis TaxID=2917832 RepID=UPI001CA6E419|nr:tRNA preQ1(34) S-adenosylmethionine ribosyltransferase-isomerase QueA [Leptothermofonsia sichuanensis]QZZ23284.1 tRNA preQ1(34) S-adenosylmethionine ribosyltransferase-isomerase QueA [Leptothermofonsia sichuanensis E412]